MANYNSIIPIMTFNSQNGFTVSATSGTSTDYYKGVDGINNGSSYYRSSVSPTLPEYYTVTFPRKCKVARYTLYLGYGSTQFANMATWEFQGLVNGVWITLHSGSNTQTANTLTFDITPTDVDAIRIKCNSRHGTNSWGFDELIVYEVVYANKILIQLGNGEYKKFDSGSPAQFSSTNAIPIMTSNTTPSPYIVSASGFDGTNYPYYAFDNSISTIWRVNATTGWLKIDLGTPKIIGKYTLQKNNSSNIDLWASDWTFEGSNDDVNWTVLHSKVGQTWSSSTYGESFDFIIDNPSSYRYYKINITKNAGNTSYLAIGNLMMYEVVSQTIPSSLVTVTSVQPTEQDFINHGMDKSTVLDLSQTLSRKSFIGKDVTTLGSGKVFSKSIDTTQLPIKKLTIQ
jgi:hypothetical protein